MVVPKEDLTKFPFCDTSLIRAVEGLKISGGGESGPKVSEMEFRTFGTL